MNQNERAEYLAQTYADAILRLSYSYLKNTHDAQDICQTVLLKLLTSPRRFAEERLERAWVVRVAVNCCKDWKKSAWVRRRLPLEAAAHAAVHLPEPGESPVLAAVQALPERYRGVPAVLRGIRAGGDRDVDGLHGQSGQHVSLPGQGKIAEHAGRRLWTGMLIRVSWTRYSSRKRGGPP